MLTSTSVTSASPSNISSSIKGISPPSAGTFSSVCGASPSAAAGAAPPSAGGAAAGSAAGAAAGSVAGAASYFNNFARLFINCIKDFYICCALGCPNEWSNKSKSDFPSTSTLR